MNKNDVKKREALNFRVQKLISKRKPERSRLGNGREQLVLEMDLGQMLEMIGDASGFDGTDLAVVDFERSGGRSFASDGKRFVEARIG